MLKRKVFPLAIDKAAIDATSSYRINALDTYIEKTAKVSRAAHVTGSTLIGAETQVGDNAEITRTIVGPRCSLGKNVRISNSIIDANVVIGDDCEIKDAIIM